MNCKNCGAPMKNGHCEYCGTHAGCKVTSQIVVTADSIKVECVQLDDDDNGGFANERWQGV